MSLSRFYKDRGEFIPEQLVPRPPEETDWHPVSIPEDSSFNDENTELDLPDASPSDLPPLPDQNTIAPLPTDTADEAESVPAEPPIVEQPETVPPPDLDAIREEAFNAGVEEGLKQAERDFGSAAGAFTQACELVNNIRETILKNSKKEMIDLVILLAEKIIRHSVTQQDATILETVEEAILKAVKSSEFHIYLHPDDLAVIKSNSAELVARVSGLENIVVKADPSIERGGCKVESDNCTVDATLASQIDSIRNRIMENQ